MPHRIARMRHLISIGLDCEIQELENSFSSGENNISKEDLDESVGHLQQQHDEMETTRTKANVVRWEGSQDASGEGISD